MRAALLRLRRPHQAQLANRRPSQPRLKSPVLVSYAWHVNAGVTVVNASAIRPLAIPPRAHPLFVLSETAVKREENVEGIQR